MANRQLDANSAAAKRQLEARQFLGENGEEYDASKFGEFGDYFRRKKIKLQNEDIAMRHSVTGKPQIFKDVAVHVASYTQPPPEELRRLVVLHGGLFIKYLDYKTMATHIVATTLPPKKADEWRRLRVVRPAWVVDSIAAGKLLPWHEYRLLGEGPGQKRIAFGGSGLSVQPGQPDQMANYREQTKSSFYTGQMQKVAAAHERTIQPTPSALFMPLETEERSGTKLQNADDDLGAISDVESLGSDLDLGQVPVSPARKDTSRKEKGIEGTEARPPPAAAKPNRVEGRSADASPQKQAQQQKPMTSEEHNALLLSDPKMRKASTANPDFLKQFYSESRLHHLSTWKAELKSKMQRLAAERASQAPPGTRHSLSGGAARRKPGARRYIMHVDFDSFFCAVSLKNAPDCVGKPAAVAHSAGSASEIASCNYPARSFGVKNGMWMGRALELCPDLKVLPYDFPAYEEASQLFYEAILDVGGVVQSVSVDEALVDITALVLDEKAADSADAGAREESLLREQAAADALASTLRARIKERTACDVSVGIGGNILLAKVALRRAKPAGQFQVRPDAVLEVLGELRVEQLPGVAYSIGGKLGEVGVHLVRDLRSVSRERLVAVLGPKTGERLWEYAHGIDRAEVGEQPVRKSVSAEVNWGIRFVSQDEADEFVRNLCRELERRLVHEQVRGRALTVKILRRAADAPLDPPKHLGHGKCDVFSKSVSFGVATHDAEVMGKEAVSVLRSYRISPGDLRGLGVQMQRLEPLRTAAGAGTAEGSQKKLSFAVGAAASVAAKSETTPREKAEEAERTGKQPIGREGEGPAPSSMPRASTVSGKTVPAFVPSTQFFMPADADFSVLAELPPDIIRRLVKQPAEEASRSDSGRSRSSSSSNQGKASVPQTPKKATRLQSESPARAADLPPDVDPDVFRALPADVQADVLAEYRHRGRQASGSPVPSPRRVASPRKGPSPLKGRKKAARGTSAGGLPQQPSPVKRGLWGTRGLGAVAAARERRHDAEANRVQTSLLAAARSQWGWEEDEDEDAARAAAFELDELDPDVLAALPDDVRAEVLDDYDRRRRQQQQQQQQQQPMERTAALRLEASRSRQASPLLGEGEGSEMSQTRLQFPAPLPKMRFGAVVSAAGADEGGQELTFSEAKDMLSAWHSATRDDGPHEADLAVLEHYVAGVVAQERDMDKARRLVTWLAWLVDEEGPGDGTSIGSGRHAWRMAVERTKQAVQKAMQSRGLGPMQF